jgi:CheY-like chemotaxis protein
LKAAPELAAIPVIMLTSRADHAVIPQLAGLGAVATLMKPFSEITLLETILGILDLKRVT